MTLLLTGTDRPFGQLAAAHFRDHDVRTIGAEIDLRQPDRVAPLVAGVQAVLHLAPCDPAPLTGARAEQDRLDLAARGTYVLMRAALEAGVERVVLASSMALFEAYPEDYMVDETWQPDPAPEADALAPYLAEITCREFARQGGIAAICLRFGRLNQAEGTSQADALGALAGALNMPLDPLGYRWFVFHVYSGRRFPMRAARQALGFASEGA